MKTAKVSESCSYSWADVVNNGHAAPARQNERLEFRWKSVKKGSLRARAATPESDCDGHHCQISEAPCTRKDCIARIDRQLVTVKAENIAVAGAFEARLRDLDQLRQEICENCKMENFFSSDMEESSLAVIKAPKKLK